MSGEGRALLEGFGFNPPLKGLVVSYSELENIDLDRLYEGNRCGASIEVAPVRMRLSDGPNPGFKISGEHNISRANFHESVRNVCSEARDKGYSPKELVFAICQSVPHEVSMSGICARVENGGFGYLSCELLDGVRRGDFTPDYAITDQIIGGRPMGHTRVVQEVQQIPTWAILQMYRIMRQVNEFNEGMIGVEFVLDKTSRRPIFHDMYWSSKLYDRLIEKFHLRKN